MFKKRIEEYLESLKSQNLYRSLRESSSSYLHNKIDKIDFSSNDYLGLANNQESINAGYEAAKIYGSGSTGSRLLSGNKEIFDKFESQIAADKNFESALIFNSGFIANAGVISALCTADASDGDKTLVIFDKLNHASMYYGISQNNSTAKNIKLARYNHLNYNQLEDILKKHDSYPNKIIASETVFGMDGDVADVGTLSSLAQKYGAVLFLDEAHATGLYGKDGYGIASDFQIDIENTIVMGTFSKALASSGAYVACSELVKEYLIQKCKGLIYSTALSPFCIGVAMYNWNLIKKKLSDTRQRILALSNDFREKLRENGYSITGSGTNIVSVIFSDIAEMFENHRKLLANNVIASAIRRPTSPSPRIRFAINALHNATDICYILENVYLL